MKKSTKPTKRPLKRLTLSISFVLASTMLYVPAYADQSNTTTSYQIQAGLLSEALNQVAQQANVSILFNSRQVGTYPATAFSGNYTANQAFEKLLENTPFQIQKTSAGYLLLDRPLSSQSQSTATTAAVTDIAQADPTAIATTTNEKAAVQLAPMVVYGEASRYEQGKNEQFDKNIVNIYKNKDEIEHFKGTNAADLFSGIAGVYSSDARNNGSLSPNIRGLQGQGRVPVVVDGTQQELTVYRGYLGVNNRSYVDPNLISEVEVYKGATDLEFGIPHGIGGAVILNTIDSKDIIPEDKNWGINLRYETNNNSTKPQLPQINYGEDFRTPDNIWTLFGDANPEFHKNISNSGKNKFFDDGAFRIAVAGKNDLTDLMLAYSYRNQGNYFSGTRGGDAYDTSFEEATEAGDIIPFAAYAPPGYEVTNTSSRNETILLKNNWYLPDNQELNLSWRHSDIEHGEIMSSRSVYAQVFVENMGLDKNSNIAIQWPLAEVKQQAGRLDYKWNPDDSKWLNLKVGSWYSNTDSRTNSSGGSPAIPAKLNATWQTFFTMMGGCFVPTNPDDPFGEIKLSSLDCKPSQATIDQMTQMLAGGGIDPENTDGQYNVVNPALIVSKNDRWGIDLSNQFELLPNLNLTLGGSLQKEKLKGDFAQTAETCSFGAGICGPLPYVFGPKSGEREEYNGWFSFDWRATDKLTFNIGGRWGKYTSFDSKLDEKLKAKEWSRPQILEKLTYEINHFITSTEYEEMEKLGYQKDSNGRFSVPDVDAYAKTKGYDGGENNYYRDEYPESTHLFYKYIYWEADENGEFKAHNAPGTVALKEGEILTWVKLTRDDGQQGLYYKAMTEEEKYAPIGKRREHSFDPSFSVTYSFTDFSRAYARYIEATRFPSLYESSIGFSEAVTDRGYKPEHARNIEVGYVHDLRQWFSSLKNADIKLNYYDNRIDDVLDRVYGSSNINQYDKQKSQGIELQSRFDQGRFFGDLGYSYLIKSEVCDKNVAAQLSPMRLDAPTCFIGGFPGGYLRGYIPPKHSITASLGVRLFDDKLTLGTRASYHSMSNLYKQKNEGWTTINSGVDAYAWKSYWLADAYMDYQATKQLKVSLIGTNLTNQYHPDVLIRTVVPAPGRTVKMAFDFKF